VSCTVRLRVSHPLQLIDGASPGADLCRRYPSSTAAPAGVLVATCLTAGQFVATEHRYGYSTDCASLLDLSLTAGDIDMATRLEFDCRGHRYGYSRPRLRRKRRTLDEL